MVEVLLYDQRVPEITKPKVSHKCFYFHAGKNPQCKLYWRKLTYNFSVHMNGSNEGTTSSESGAFSFISSMTRNFAVCEICRALNLLVSAKLNPSSFWNISRHRYTMKKTEIKIFFC